MKRMQDVIFQAGVVLGRITQLCADRGVVAADSEIALADLIVLFSDELESLPVTENTRTIISSEIHDLSQAIAGYTKNQRLNPDEARIMIRLVSRWTDILLDEFIRDTVLTSPSPISKNRDTSAIRMEMEKPLLPGTGPDNSNKSGSLDESDLDDLPGSIT